LILIYLDSTFCISCHSRMDKDRFFLPSFAYFTSIG
jgi:hypothetical protein